MRGLQKAPEIVQALFNHKRLSYIQSKAIKMRSVNCQSNN